MRGALGGFREWPVLLVAVGSAVIGVMTRPVIRSLVRSSPIQESTTWDFVFSGYLSEYTSGSHGLELMDRPMDRIHIGFDAVQSAQAADRQTRDDIPLPAK